MSNKSFLPFRERDLSLSMEDENFDGYMETAIDPGPYMLIFTIIVSSIIILSLPVWVVLGKRYEKKRILEEEAALIFAAKDGDINTMNQPVNNITEPPSQMAATKGRSKKRHARRNNDDLEVDLEASNRKSNNSTNEVTFSLPEKPRRHNSNKTRGEDPSVVSKNTRTSRASRASRNSRYSDSQSVMTGMTNASSYIHGRTKSEVSGTASSLAWKNLVDKVIMPPYQDDESRSVLTRDDRSLNPGMSRRSAATLSSVVSSSSGNFAQTTNILDTRATRRRGRLYNNIGDNRKRRTQKQSRREAVLNPYTEADIPRYSRRKATRNWSDTKSDIVTINEKKQSSNQTVVSEMYTTQSTMTGRFSAGSNPNSRGRSRFGFSSKKRSTSPISIAPSMLSRIDDDISPNDAADANDPGQPSLYPDEQDELQICCGSNALWRPSTMFQGLDYLIDLAQPDSETRRILKLGIPFTLAVVLESIFEIVEVALVGRFVSTEALTAYALTDLLGGTTGEFIGGLYDAAMTVCPHAIGTGNNYLCGQYIQITVWLYVFALIPECLFWWYYMDDLVVWFGLSQEVGDMAQAYTRVAMFGEIIGELADIFHGLLEVTEHEAFSATIGIVEGLVGVTTVCYLLYFYEMTLVDLAYVEIVLNTIFFIITIVISWKYGWVKEYVPGMLQNFALKNKIATKNVLNTAWPLALGSLLAYAEWEVLTIFAKYLGPAEVSAWAILGYIWETFEASTEGIGDAAEVRVAFHLGKGNPEMARISSQKSMLLGTIFGTFLTSLFFIIGDTLPTWFTDDVTLQEMIRSLLPMIGIGNVTMTFGFMCWAIIGAQGRYRLATLVAFVTTWGVTLPMAAVMTYVFRFNLQGITSSVVIGYSVAMTVMSYIVLRSDWARLSKIIIDLNKITGGEDSSDSEGEGAYSSSSSSASSSSSSEDSDDDDDDF